MKYHVCTNDVGEAHHCKLCKNNFHWICGNLMKIKAIVNQLCVSLAPKKVCN